MILSSDLRDKEISTLLDGTVHQISKMTAIDIQHAAANAISWRAEDLQSILRVSLDRPACLFVLRIAIQDSSNNLILDRSVKLGEGAQDDCSALGETTGNNYRLGTFGVGGGVMLDCFIDSRLSGAGCGNVVHKASSI